MVFFWDTSCLDGHYSVRDHKNDSKKGNEGSKIHDGFTGGAGTGHAAFSAETLDSVSHFAFIDNAS